MNSQQEGLNVKDQELPAESSLQNRRRRRSKNEATGRNFVCQCGKSYLSYSALYTHSKVKHHSKITFHESIYGTANTVADVKCNSLDLELLRTLKEDEGPYSLSHLQLLLKVAKDELKQQFVKTASCKKMKINNSVFLDKYKKYWENRDIDDEVMNQEEIYVTSIDRALGYLLIKCEKIFDRVAFQFFQIFVMTLRVEYNQMKENEKYTEGQIANKFPCEMNKIIETKFKSNSVFKQNRTLTCMLIYHICRWLREASFTNFKLTLNLAEEG